MRGTPILVEAPKQPSGAREQETGAGMSSYLKVVYDTTERPYTPYPEQLTHHLFERFGLAQGMRLLEPGCGRGEFLNGFRKLGLECHGCDIAPDAQGFLDGIPVTTCDLDSSSLPYPDDHFDVVYNKSLLEHLRNPEHFARECLRVLKPGGLLLCLVPDWEANYKIYFDDYTHVTPFTVVSLRDLYRISGFLEVSAVKFRQLPIVWKHPWLNGVCAAISPFVPVRTRVPLLRWSRELMLVGSGRKP